ncbi:MAG: NAD kinase [Bacteroidetes bacterium]|nr:NAD kinase [Bacteroidota bacterium]
MKVAIYSRNLSDNHANFVNELVCKLIDKQIEVIVFELLLEFLKKHINVDKELKTFKNSKELDGVDYMFSVGGDGTLLQSISFVSKLQLPVLGINTGRLGFLTSVSSQEIDEAIKSILSKNFDLDTRSMLEVELKNNPFGALNFALNEVTIQKKDSSAMIIIHTYLDGKFLNSYWADGLIVSTPTGSTAYSLSCNGPIVLPNSGNIIITPIAPHNLNVRPLVIPDNIEVRLLIESRAENCLVALDYKSETIPVSTEIIIKKSKEQISIIRLKKHDFLSTLRNKLMWGLDKRN